MSRSQTRRDREKDLRRMQDGLVALRDKKVPEGFDLIMHVLGINRAGLTLADIGSTKEDVVKMYRSTVMARTQRGLDVLCVNFDEDLFNFVMGDLEFLEMEPSAFISVLAHASDGSLGYI